MKTQDRPLPPIAFSVAVALLATLASWDLYGVDVEAFLLPWFDHIRATGPIAVFAQPFANYSPPYLYLMAAISPAGSLLAGQVLLKLLSFAGHLMLGAAIFHLLGNLGLQRRGRAVVFALIMPTLLVSPAIMVQCDALWSAALVMALAAAMRSRHATMLIWCGLAVAIKAQAAFVAPFFLGLVLARRVRVAVWGFAPLSYAAAMLPAALAGWPVGDLLLIYLRQSQWTDALSLSAPNIWSIVEALPGTPVALLGPIAGAMTGIVAASLVIWMARNAERLDPVMLVRAACLCALIVPGLLPRMHERYFFLSDVLAIVIALMRAGEWRLVIFTQIGSGLAILAYMTGLQLLAAIGGVSMIIATWLVAQPFLIDLKGPGAVPATA